jgi:hypothetical protein
LLDKISILIILLLFNLKKNSGIGQVKPSTTRNHSVVSVMPLTGPFEIALKIQNQVFMAGCLLSKPERGMIEEKENKNSKRFLNLLLFDLLIA